MIKIKCGNDRCKRTWEKAKRDPGEIALLGMFGVIGVGGPALLLTVIGMALYYATGTVLLAIAAGAGFLAVHIIAGLIISYLMEPK